MRVGRKIISELNFGIYDDSEKFPIPKKETLKGMKKLHILHPYDEPKGKNPVSNYFFC